MQRSDSSWWSEGYTREWWYGLPAAQRLAFLEALTDREVEEFHTDWRVWARDNQLLPDGQWHTALALAGRGWGKSRTGAEWIIEKKKQLPTGARFCLLGQGADDVRDVMIEGDALDLETPIPTPTGWIRFGDLKPGDKLFARDGSVTEVVAVTPVWNSRPCYAVTADGAAPIIADARHKWVTRSRADRRPDVQRREVIRRTEEMVGRVTHRRSDLYEFELPMHRGLDLPPVDLTVPPYTLGAWLGDGATRGGTFTCHPDDVETIENIRADGFEVNQVVGVYAWGIRKLTKRLKVYGLAGKKFIPSIYLRASHAQRLALLAGLMDTDGYVSKRGQCAFDNTNLMLVTQVRELLLSLGYKPGTIQSKKARAGGGLVPHRGRDFKTVYRITFTCSPENAAPFRLKRKVERCRVGYRCSGRLVRSIEPVDSVPVCCIQVAHPSGTFLAGEDFVVTHNSGILACSPSWDRPKWQPSVGGGRLYWKNGTTAFVFSAADTEGLRGPQFHAAWVDEPMAMPPEQRAKAISNLRFGLRLGQCPQILYTTTPKPHRWLTEMVDKAKKSLWSPHNPGGKYVLIKGDTYENVDLPETFRQMILDDYEGSNLGRQEIYAEILNDEAGALWTSNILDATRILPDHGMTHDEFAIKFAKTCSKVVVAVDPNVTSTGVSHEAGIIVVGRKGDNRYTLADRSCKGGPQHWGAEAIRAFQDFDADVVVAEVNQGGDLVKKVITDEAKFQEIDVQVVKVRATRGKHKRAEPVSASYERKLIGHVGACGHEKEPGEFYKLEQQMCALHDGYDPTGEDFDRCDANVWGHTYLAKRSEMQSKGTSGIFTFREFAGAAR